jgi:hypothetical protein
MMLQKRKENKRKKKKEPVCIALQHTRWRVEALNLS